MSWDSIKNLLESTVDGFVGLLDPQTAPQGGSTPTTAQDPQTGYAPSAPQAVADAYSGLETPAAPEMQCRLPTIWDLDAGLRAVEEYGLARDAAVAARQSAYVPDVTGEVVVLGEPYSSDGRPTYYENDFRTPYRIEVLGDVCAADGALILYDGEYEIVRRPPPPPPYGDLEIPIYLSDEPVRSFDVVDPYARTTFIPRPPELPGEVTNVQVPPPLPPPGAERIGIPGWGDIYAVPRNPGEAALLSGLQAAYEACTPFTPVAGADYSAANGEAIADGLLAAAERRTTGWQPPNAQDVADIYGEEPPVSVTWGTEPSGLTLRFNERTTSRTITIRPDTPVDIQYNGETIYTVRPLETPSGELLTGFCLHDEVGMSAEAKAAAGGTQVGEVAIQWVRDGTGIQYLDNFVAWREGDRLTIRLRTALPETSAAVELSNGTQAPVKAGEYLPFTLADNTFEGETTFRFRADGAEYTVNFNNATEEVKIWNGPADETRPPDHTTRLANGGQRYGALEIDEFGLRYSPFRVGAGGQIEAIPAPAHVEVARAGIATSGRAATPERTTPVVEDQVRVRAGRTAGTSTEAVANYSGVPIAEPMVMDETSIPAEPSRPETTARPAEAAPSMGAQMVYGGAIGGVYGGILYPINTGIEYVAGPEYAPYVASVVDMGAISVLQTWFNLAGGMCLADSNAMIAEGGPIVAAGANVVGRGVHTAMEAAGVDTTSTVARAAESVGTGAGTGALAAWMWPYIAGTGPVGFAIGTGLYILSDWQNNARAFTYSVDHALDNTPYEWCGDPTRAECIGSTGQVVQEVWSDGVHTMLSVPETDVPVLDSVAEAADRNLQVLANVVSLDVAQGLWSAASGGDWCGFWEDCFYE